MVLWIQPLVILLLDNFDSFVYNLARYFQLLGHSAHVVRSNATDVDEIRDMRPSAIVISPGPCTPNEAGCSLHVVRELHQSIPILGVCLGHQAIGQAFGARIVRAREPKHGVASLIRHNGAGLFEDLPNPLQVGRYHSLVIDPATIPASLEVTSVTEDGVMMAIQHREFPVFGVQFHPESVLTTHGFEILSHFLKLSGLSKRDELTIFREPLPSLAEKPDVWPSDSMRFTW